MRASENYQSIILSATPQETEANEVIAVIELKSLILAQIERWRHALHMQVERQRGSLLLPASGERVSNASERVLLWGITDRKIS